MQALRKQPDPPAREKSFQQLERERIADEYDRQHGKGVYAVNNDADDDDSYRTPAERRAVIDARLEADGGASSLTRRQEAYGRIYSRPEEPAPEVAPDDVREPAHQAVDAFLEKNPKFTKEKEWKVLRKTALESQHDDLIMLRQRAEKTGTRADYERLLTRAVDVAETEAVTASRREAVQKMAAARSPILDLKP